MAEEGGYDNPLANTEDEKVVKTPETLPPPYDSVTRGYYDVQVGLGPDLPGHLQMGISTINAHPNQAIDAVVVRPTSIVTMQAPPKPPNYRALSIASFCCCNWCLGLAAMHHSFQCDHFYSRGEYEEAQRSSQNARHYSIMAMIIGFVLIIIWVVFTMFTVAKNNRL